ncbi:MAG: type VI secretion system protein TssA [Planctomycetota bacterium]
MASPPALELDALLLPISESSPTGTDQREDASPTSPFRDARSTAKDARAAERHGQLPPVVGQDEAERWRPILDLGAQVLKEQSKDLEVAALMIEALARTNGFAGLRDGFRLARELVERFWDQLHPMPDEYGLETRVAPLAGLNGSGGNGVLIQPIARIALVPSAGDVGPFAAWSIDQAVEIERLEPDKKTERLGAGGTDIEKVRQAVASTDSEVFGTLQEDLLAAIEEWKLLRAALDERAESHSPPTSNVRSALDNALGRLRHVAGDRMPAEPEPAPEGGEAAENGAAPDAPAGGAPGAAAAAAGQVADREQAFRALNQIADFFRRSEPHSPIPYLLERAVRWGRTPLHELLPELIQDPNARTMFNSLTGVDSTTPKNEQ